MNLTEILAKLAAGTLLSAAEQAFLTVNIGDLTAEQRETISAYLTAVKDAAEADTAELATITQAVAIGTAIKDFDSETAAEVTPPAEGDEPAEGEAEESEDDEEKAAGTEALKALTAAGAKVPRSKVVPRFGGVPTPRAKAPEVEPDAEWVASVDGREVPLANLHHEVANRMQRVRLSSDISNLAQIRRVNARAVPDGQSKDRSFSIEEQIEGRKAQKAKHAEWMTRQRMGVLKTPDNLEKFQSLTAAGGSVVPATPVYELPMPSSAVRPVAESLMHIDASARGAITYRQVPSPVTAYASAIDIWTVTRDGSAAALTTPPTDTKAKVHITIPSPLTTRADAITSRLGVGNFQSLFDPEGTMFAIEAAKVAWARRAENSLLAKAFASVNSSQTSKQFSGAVPDFLASLDTLLAQRRYSLRLAADDELEALLPIWTLDLMRADMARQAPGDDIGHFSVSDAMIGSWLSDRKVVATFHLDDEQVLNAAGTTVTTTPPWTGTTGTGTVPLANPAVNQSLTRFPASVRGLIFPPGALGWLDAGVLDLGVTRDTTTNAVNDAEWMFESFENLVNLGPEVIAMEFQVQANGARSSLSTYSAYNTGTADASRTTAATG